MSLPLPRVHQFENVLWFLLIHDHHGGECATIGNVALTG